ncbi:MAG TPA: glycosyltransferase family 4 protein, partial [Candidatus Dormibacteraeota bacterium]|nr:glycosyltransferase family 4 protein [Candidatus Dormibacteraeota bacterium]
VRSSFAPEIRDRVSVVPFVSRNEMPAVYASHDIFVFPSLVEGMPLTLLEAMASGMPVVTTISSGMQDVVEDGFNGLLVPPANSSELVAAIRKLCGSAEICCRLGHEAQNTMRRYTWPQVTGLLEKLLAIPMGNRRNK